MRRRRFLAGLGAVVTAGVFGEAVSRSAFLPPRTVPSAVSATDPTAAPAATTSSELLGIGRVVTGTFASAALRRTMPYTVYLPPGYDAAADVRYPTLYMLHGGSGTNREWIDYGLLDAANALMGPAAIPPFIIVLPQGDQEYWVDHVVDARTGANGERWGTYTAREVVPTIDARFRTIADSAARAIGGLSMGGHAAMQLSLNFPGIWSAIGAHSPSLRHEGDAPTYLGSGADFAARDPLSLIDAKPDLARSYAWWVDAGNVDPWIAQATTIHEKLDALGIANEWRPWPGDHSLAYWSSHVGDYLEYYAGAIGGAV
jgi:S-formylglutathione hydrolase FrmB